MKIAVVDVGSNAARLGIYRVWRDGEVVKSHQIEFIRFPIRLGDSVFNSGLVTLEKKEKFIKLMQVFHNLIDLYEATDYKAYATSALREAENGQLILKEIIERTGLEVSTISGLKEAELLLSAHKNLIDSTECSLLIDVGGGSTELSFIDNISKSAKQESFPIGALRDPSEEQFGAILASMKAWLAQLNSKGLISVFCTGGNINKAHTILGSKKDKQISSAKLVDLQKNLNLMTLSERVNKLSLTPERADIMPTALLIYNFVLTELKIKFFTASGLSLRDGMVHELISQNLDKL
jgi:exopolyphosphatase/guanosine-5'-triphosphate,3'-diphosphate pyrophosphatase